MMDKISVGEVTRIGVGFALGYLAYKLICLTSEPESTPHIKQAQSQMIKTQQQKNKHELEELEQLQQVLIHKSTNFELQTLPQNPQILTKKCLLEFFNQTYDILDADEIVKVVLQNRVARRIVFHDLGNKYETYFRFVCTLDQSIKYLVEKAQKDFAVFLNLDYQRVVDSIGYYLQVQDEDQCQGCQQFRLQVVQVMSATRQSLMNYLPLFNTPIPKPQLLQLLTYQSNHLEQHKEEITELVQKMGLQTKQQQQAIPLFITCYMQDMIYKTYKIESQQMNISFEDMDQQLRGVFQKWKSIREDVIRSIHQAIVIDHVIIRDEDEQY